MMVGNNLFDINIHRLRNKDLLDHKAGDGKHVSFFQDATISTDGSAAVDLVVKLFEQLRDVLLVGGVAILLFDEDVFEGLWAGGGPLRHVSGVLDGAAQVGRDACAGVERVALAE